MSCVEHVLPGARVWVCPRHPFIGYPCDRRAGVSNGPEVCFVQLLRPVSSETFKKLRALPHVASVSKMGGADPQRIMSLLGAVAGVQ